MIVAVLNGWGSSSRLRETRTATLVRELTTSAATKVLAKRAMVLWARSRRFKRFILENDTPHQSLLCVGKSLGARNMVTRILNDLPALKYRRVGLVTIDPCWPVPGDWTPNLNRTMLELTHRVDRAENVFVVGTPDMQAGAILRGQNVVNTPVSEADHFSIVQHPMTRRAIEDMVRFLKSQKFAMVNRRIVGLE